jgi:hypothetical protein
MQDKEMKGNVYRKDRHTLILIIGYRNGVRYGTVDMGKPREEPCYELNGVRTRRRQV